MKRFVLGALVLMLIVCTGAWSAGKKETETEKTTSAVSGPQYGGNLRYGVTALTNLDVASVNQYGVNEVAQQFYETLVDRDENGEVAPLLLKSWDISDDGLTHTWHLEEGVTFHNGSPFNADVVKWNIERKIAQKGPMWSTIPWADEPITVIDDLTLKANLSRSYAGIYNTLTIKTFSMYDPVWVKEVGKDALNTQFNGTGPFMMTEYSVNEYLKLEKFPNYWQEGLPYLDSIEYIVIPDNTTRALMMESGELDMVSTISTMDIARMESDSDLKVISGVSSRVYYMALDNMDAPLDDVNVRRAINYAVNKKGMIGPIFNNMVSLMKSNLLTKAVGGFHANEPYYYNPEKARSLLASSGWKDTNGDGYVDKAGKNMELKMVNREGSIAGDTEIPELVQGMLKEVGIKVNIETVDSATLLTNMNQDRAKVPQYDMIYFSWATFAGNADYTLNSGYATSAHPPKYWNYAWYSNPEVDRLIEEGNLATDLSVQNEKFAKAQEIAWDEACNLFLYEALASSVMKKNVNGIYLDPSQSIWPAKYAWISK